MKNKILIILAGVLLISANSAFGQQFAIKTNALYWATTTPNLGAELKIAPKTTIDFVGTNNPFTFKDNKKFKNWTLQPELRFWMCEAFNRGFFGIHGTYGQYNAGGVNVPFGIFSDLSTNRYEGTFYGGGISYGYQWYLAPNWNLEATLGIGYYHAKYKQFECVECGDFIKEGTKNYFGPTRFGLSIVYLFNSKK